VQVLLLKEPNLGKNIVNKINKETFNAILITYRLNAFLSRQIAYIADFL